MKKAQAAMEFLMTYGWAILVVLIAIGALMYFIKPTDILPEKCIITTGSGLFCDKWGASAGQIDLKIKNALNEQLTITTASYIGDGTNQCAPAADVNIAADGSATVSFTADTLVGACDDLAASGAKIQGDISLTVTDTDAFTKTTSGSLIVKVP
ncbi:MAG: hypothetical protein ABIC04_00815 [Nanoarchaeota archaeon]